ncbi:anti-sigma factor [Halobacillus shinanisalinarum]|uniref:Anti-sigma-W factor RsiW n=1 Tax=Halobacillus shinanisalinarum TaxID=2932258 RepID=A0ABY4GU76_9BACI|nr:anti-sigma factor [Halobacillus shinanisalinarum]UOQ91706.1 anti-sigma factor [Halobacillus shinanisalinarum]
MRNECEKVIDFFNNQLSDVEEREFEKHLETCDDCQEELAELRALTEDLAFASEPVNPPEGMKDRVLDAVFAGELNDTDDKRSEQAEGQEDSSVVAYEPRKDRSEQGLQPRKTKKPWILRGLAAALILSLAGNLYAVMNEDETATQGPVEGPGDPTQSTDQVTTKVQLQGTTNAQATASMIQQEHGGLLTLQAESLEQLEGEEVYQVWLIEGETPHRAGTFVANENGQGAVAYAMDQLPEGTDWNAVAISREPDATSQAPQGEVILQAEL